MEGIRQVTLEGFLQFFLVFIRLSAFSVTAPIIGSRNVPVQTKIGFGALLTLIILPVLRPVFPAIPDQLLGYALLIGQEAVVGLILGFACVLIFAGAQISGQIFGMQMGLGIVNVIDPQSDLQISLMGQLQFLLAMLLFLAVNGHYMFVRALVESYELIPVSGLQITGAMAWQLVKMFGDVFIIGIKVGAPVIAVLMVVNAAMGLVARTVPQMNIFIVGIPINIMVGFFVLGSSLFFIAAVWRGYFDQFFRDLLILMRTMG